MGRRKRKKLWSVTRISDPRHPGYTLRVTELTPGGNLYVVRMVDGKQRMASMGTKRKDFGEHDKGAGRRGQGPRTPRDRGVGPGRSRPRSWRRGAPRVHRTLGTAVPGPSGPRRGHHPYHARRLSTRPTDSMVGARSTERSSRRRSGGWRSFLGEDRNVCSLCSTDVRPSPPTGRSRECGRGPSPPTFRL
jgi:hypothetical protein